LPRDPVIGFHSAASAFLAMSKPKNADKDARYETSVRRPHVLVGPNGHLGTMSTSAAIRKPMFPALLSGEFALRAAQRYRQQ